MAAQKQTPCTMVAVSGRTTPLLVFEEYDEVRSAIGGGHAANGLIELTEVSEERSPVTIRARAIDWFRPSVLPFHLDPLGGAKR